MDEEGLKQGMQKGVKHIALGMLSINMDIGTISENIGFTIYQLQQLSQNN